MVRQKPKLWGLYEDVRSKRRVIAQGKEEAMRMLGLSHRECRNYMSCLETSKERGGLS